MSERENIRVCVGSNVTAREFDGELVILDLAGGQYFGVNEVGARLWERLLLGKSPAEVASELAADYDVEPAQLLADLLALTDELLARRLVVRIEGIR